MEEEKIKRHRWDYITDTCKKCGLQRRTKKVYAGMTFFCKGTITEYNINGMWVDKYPSCK